MPKVDRHEHGKGVCRVSTTSKLSCRATIVLLGACCASDLISATNGYDLVVWAKMDFIKVTHLWEIYTQSLSIRMQHTQEALTWSAKFATNRFYTDANWVLPPANHTHVLRRHGIGWRRADSRCVSYCNPLTESKAENCGSLLWMTHNGQSVAVSCSHSMISQRLRFTWNF